MSVNSIRTKMLMMSALTLLPVLMGANCSRNAVVQSGATTFVNNVASSLASLIFSALTGTTG
jgi:hypothetical protein